MILGALQVWMERLGVSIRYAGMVAGQEWLVLMMSTDRLFIYPGIGNTLEAAIRQALSDVAQGAKCTTGCLVECACCGGRDVKLEGETLHV